MALAINLAAVITWWPKRYNTISMKDSETSCPNHVMCSAGGLCRIPIQYGTKVLHEYETNVKFT